MRSSIVAVLFSLVSLTAVASPVVAPVSSSAVRSGVTTLSQEMQLNQCRWVRVCGPRGCVRAWRCY